MVVEGKFNNCIGIAAMIDGALKEVKARAVIVQERSCMAVNLLVNFVDQSIELLFFVWTDPKFFNSLHPLTQWARAYSLPISSDQSK